MVCIRIMQPETLFCKVCAASMSYAWQGVSSGPWGKQSTLAPLRRKRAEESVSHQYRLDINYACLVVNVKTTIAATALNLTMVSIEG